ncbi:MAG: hypothetical protein Q8P62_00070 [Candidatus Peregrinibacteria bacterium]|nr:hypothetical protein [Candidatus Peregrinibacteria bacterium]
MEVSYNVRYQKSNFSSKVLIDKEGEVIIYGKGFRLKGKGAQDKGELINFSEIKEFYFNDDKILFITFNKEKYSISDSGTLFDQMLIDIYKARNEFLMDALFMKGGKLRAEYEGDYQRLSKFGKLISKGDAKLRLYERSLIVVPETSDAFSIHYDFVNYHEFDEMEYNLKIVMDDGTNMFFSGLGNDFEFFQEKMNELLGGMYETLVNDVLKRAFPEFHAATLLKLGYKMKGGKAVSLKDLQKMDKDLAVAVDKFIFEDEKFVENVKPLRELTNEHEVFYGIARDDAVKGSYIRWVMFAVPSKNIVGFSILPRWQEGGAKDQNHQHEMYFFKIIMEQGNAAEKTEDKIREVDEALVTLNFTKDPCYKDKRELRHSPYQYAIRKLPFLRILRKSYVGKISSSDKNEWKTKLEEIFKNAMLPSA